MDLIIGTYLTRVKGKCYFLLVLNFKVVPKLNSHENILKFCFTSSLWMMQRKIGESKWKELKCKQINKINYIIIIILPDYFLFDFLHFFHKSLFPQLNKVREDILDKIPVSGHRQVLVLHRSLLLLQNTICRKQGDPAMSTYYIA